MTPVPTSLPEPIAAALEPPSPLILVAEDDLEMREVLRQALERGGFRVALCPHGLDLLVHLTDPGATPPLRDVSLIISDIRMPGISGLEVVCGLQPDTPLPPVILITAFGDAAVHTEARRLGVRAVLDKPFDVGDLLATVREILPFPPGVRRTGPATGGIPARGVAADGGAKSVLGGALRSWA